jgi:SNF2 family DNA or RNA helicase
MLGARAVLLAFDVGLGKTCMTIGAILQSFEEGTINKVLILCPSSVKHQWRDEFEKFASPKLFPDILQHIEIASGTAKRRERLYSEEWNVLIMTYQTFLRDHRKLPAFDCAVLDEASAAIKNRNTKTAKAVKEVLSDCQYRFALTATPIENRLHDLYSICEWLDLTVFPGVKWFEKEYCNIIEIKIKQGRRIIRVPKVIGYRNLQDAKKRMEHVYLRRTFQEVGAQLPEVVSTTLRLELTKRQRELYNKIRAEIQASKEDDRIALIGQIVKLREICDSSGLISGAHHSSKLDELKRIMEELPEGDKIVVFSEFRRMTDEIVRALKQYSPMYLHGGTVDEHRSRIRKQFAAVDDNRILVMTSAGERGLNLQCAGILVNFELPYNPARLKQRIGRLWRIGSEHETVRVLNMVTEDTFEDRVLALLNTKEKLFDVIFEPDGIDRIGDPVGKLSTAGLRRLL